MTAASTFVHQFYQLAKSNGMDADALLERAEIDPIIMKDSNTRVDTAKLAVIVVEVWNYLQDEAMGLSSSRIPRGAFFTMGKLAIHELNLGQALQVGCDFYSMVTKAFRAELIVEGDIATLKFHRCAVEADPHHLFGEINILAWHRFSSWLISENVNLNQIYFDYPMPPHVSEYAYLFPGKHCFNSSFQGFSFKRQFMDCRISQSLESLKAFNTRCPEELFKQPKTDFSLTRELKQLLKKHIKHGFPKIEAAAESLNLTKRTLIRKLKEEGTSYQQIKDLVRRDRAIYLLSSPTVPVSAIAESVGFSDAAVFARAFKTWAGVSPREYREEAVRNELGTPPN